MIALSIRQPWAWLIVNGHKDIENRSWPTKVRGTVLVHAGKRIDHEDYDECVDICIDIGAELPDKFDLGGIVGSVEIVDCVAKSDSPWFFGAYGFVLRNAKPLPFRPCRGQLGFFEVAP